MCVRRLMLACKRARASALVRACVPTEPVFRGNPLELFVTTYFLSRYKIRTFFGANYWVQLVEPDVFRVSTILAYIFAFSRIIIEISVFMYALVVFGMFPVMPLSR